MWQELLVFPIVAASALWVLWTYAVPAAAKTGLRRRVGHAAGRDGLPMPLRRVLQRWGGSRRPPTCPGCSGCGQG